jgi:phosphoribosylformimino-5-aminoimidazole carboxamide ribonucleotide (ProFAR) isomerase
LPNHIAIRGKSMKISDLQSARDTNNRKYLEEQFRAARKTLEAGGTVRVEQEFSDTRVETVHIIDNLDDLKLFENKYLN